MVSYMMARPFPYNAARFRFGFRLHLVAITVLALVAVVILRLSPRYLILAYLLMIGMVTVAALMFLNALPPVRTTHSVDGEAVILRQGLNFKLSIPLSKISKAKRTDVGSGRAGIRLERENGVLEVIASGPEAVRLRLNDPVVHKGTLVREVLVDVLEPREFIECIRERKRGLVLIERMDGGRRPEPAREEAPEESEGAEEGTDAEPEAERPAPEVARKAVTADRMRTRDVVRSGLLETPAPVPPPIRLAKSPSRPAPARAPVEPEGEPASPTPKRDDEDEIELVPAFPSSTGAQARVVRIPKRKP